MECPHCHSSDVKRSRRKLAERFLLPVFRARAVRCVDCRTRFWAGVEWGSVILACLSLTVTASLVGVVVFAHEKMSDNVAAAPVTMKRHRVRRPMPRGLPPLASVPRPAGDSVQTAR